MPWSTRTIAEDRQRSPHNAWPPPVVAHAKRVGPPAPRRCPRPLATAELRQLACLACWAIGLSALGPPDARAELEPRPALASALGPLVAAHCADCHSADQAEAGLNLVKLVAAESLWEQRHRWQHVRQRLAAGDMPPPDHGQIPEAERAAALTWLDAELAGPDCNGPPDPGRPTLRRLNRAEYQATVRDLLGVTCDAEKLLPADELGYGFDNNGDVLSLSPLSVEKYLAAAESIALSAVTAPEQVREPRQRFTWRELRGGDAAGEGLRSLHTNGEIWVEAQTEQTEQGDRYAVQVRAFATQAGDEPTRMELFWDDATVQSFAVEATRSDPQTYVAVVTPAPGQHRFGVRFVNDFWNPLAPEGERDRNLFVEAIRLVGPLPASVPDDSPLAPLLGDGPDLATWRADDAWRPAATPVTRTWLRRAFRRPPTDDEVERLVDLAGAARGRGDTWERAWQLVLRATLASPQFLFRGEWADDPQEIRPLDDYELATRLSYFLWSSTPDDALLAAAEAGAVRRDLDAHLARLLADPRSDALVRQFGEQWLETRRLVGLSRDPEAFPEFDDALRDALREETFLVLREILRSARPLTELLTADYTYLNARLATHYGAPWDGADSATEFRRVAAPARRNAGILTLGGVLTVTSHVDQTSPTLRGKWMLERLLNDPPPPPPPDVPALPPADPEQPQGASLRERLAAHVADPGCAACHRRMDPLGLALENFDATGRWREEDAGAAVDASGELPDGRQFVGAEGLREVLLADFDRFRRALAEQLLTYALGRGLEIYDVCAVNEITLATMHGGDTLPALIRAIVMSAPFQQRHEELP